MILIKTNPKTSTYTNKWIENTRITWNQINADWITRSWKELEWTSSFFSPCSNFFNIFIEQVNDNNRILNSFFFAVSMFWHIRKWIDSYFFLCVSFFFSTVGLMFCGNIDNLYELYWNRETSKGIIIVYSAIY